MSELPKLPQGWIWTNFVEMANASKNSLKAGPFGSALKKEFYVESGYKIYGQEQVIREDPFYGNYYINEQKYEQLKSCSVQPGDILISLVGTIGKVLILPEGIKPGIINPRLVKLSLSKSAAISEYVKAYLESWSAHYYLSERSHGGTMEILNLTILKSLPVPLPPLNEQRRIVAKLEKLLTKCEVSKQRLDKIPHRLKQFRQSILAAACSGRLTADWRTQHPNTEPASELLKRIEDERENNYQGRANQAIAPTIKEALALPQKWCLVTLDQLSLLVTSGSRGWAKYYSDSDSGSYFIRAQDINTDTLKLDDIAYVNPPQGSEGERTKVGKGDVLITITGANVKNLH
ncbi:MAG: hypothetical protein F6K30_13455 [Cyanothece sp. SIO2G6]|nr:hypothetical protein [Cyanothece sp. SIO2G6]